MAHKNTNELVTARDLSITKYDFEKSLIDVKEALKKDVSDYLDGNRFAKSSASKRIWEAVDACAKAMRSRAHTKFYLE